MVVQIPTPPSFVQHLSNIAAEEGSRVILEGVVKGKPEPSISWYRKSTPITDSPDFRLEYRPDGTVKLTLPEVIIGPIVHFFDKKKPSMQRFGKF